MVEKVFTRCPICDVMYTPQPTIQKRPDICGACDITVEETLVEYKLRLDKEEEIDHTILIIPEDQENGPVRNQ